MSGSSSKHSHHPDMVQLRLSKRLITQLVRCKHTRLLVGDATNRAMTSVGCGHDSDWHRTADDLQALLPGGLYVIAVFLPPSLAQRPGQLRSAAVHSDTIVRDNMLYLLTHDRIGQLKALQPNVTLSRLGDHLIENEQGEQEEDALDPDKFVRGRIFLDLKVPVNDDDLEQAMADVGEQLRSAVIVDETSAAGDARGFTLIAPTTTSKLVSTHVPTCWLSIHGWFYVCALNEQHIGEDLERSVQTRLPAHITPGTYQNLPCRCAVGFSSLEISDYQVRNETNANTLARFSKAFGIDHLQLTDVRQTVEREMLGSLATVQPAVRSSSSWPIDFRWMLLAVACAFAAFAAYFLMTSRKRQMFPFEN